MRPLQNLGRSQIYLMLRRGLLIGLLGAAIALAWRARALAPEPHLMLQAQASPLISPLNPVTELLVDESSALGLGSFLARSQLILPVVLVTLLFMLVAVSLAAWWRS